MMISNYDFCVYWLFYCCTSISVMAFGVTNEDGDITANGIITGCLTALMSLLVLAVAFKVKHLSILLNINSNILL